MRKGIVTMRRLFGEPIGAEDSAGFLLIDETEKRLARNFDPQTRVSIRGEPWKELHV